MPIIDPDQGASLPSLADLANNQAAFSNFYANLLSRNNLRYTDDANRTLLHPANTEGEESYLTTSNRKEINDGTNWVSLAAKASQLFFVSTSNQNLTLSSTAFQNLTGFSTPVVNGGGYLVEGYVIYSSSTTADIKVTLNSPATSIFRLSSMGLALGAASNEADLRNIVVTAPLGVVNAGGTGVGTFLGMHLSAYVVPSASGTLQLQAAQNAVDATQSVVYSGTWMRVARMS